MTCQSQWRNPAVATKRKRIDKLRHSDGTCCFLQSRSVDSGQVYPALPETLQGSPAPDAGPPKRILGTALVRVLRGRHIKFLGNLRALALPHQLPAHLFPGSERHHYRLTKRIRVWYRPLFFDEGESPFISGNAVKICPVVRTKAGEPVRPREKGAQDGTDNQSKSVR